jgi:hypothetical protein
MRSSQVSRRQGFVRKAQDRMGALHLNSFEIEITINIRRVAEHYSASKEFKSNTAPIAWSFEKTEQFSSRAARMADR